MRNKKNLPENFNRQTEYKIHDAVELLPKLSTSKFVGTINIDIVLKLSDKQKKESIRGSVVFPHQFSKEKRVIVFAKEQDAKKALSAGAIDAGLEELVKKVETGKTQFDVAIATPDVMPVIAKLGKVLGPKGLMPNPANGTVTTDIEKAIQVYKAGKVDFKMNEQGTIKAGVAKLDMKPEQISENIEAFIKSALEAIKKVNSQAISKIFVSPTMGERVSIALGDFLE